MRREDGGLSLLHNRCAHRGARIISAPSGNTRQLRCPYHAWTYRLDGSLIGVPLAEGYAQDARLPGLTPCRAWRAIADSSSPRMGRPVRRSPISSAA